jgi:hypothetical protein
MLTILYVIFALYLAVALAKFVLLLGGVATMVQAVTEEHVDNWMLAVCVCVLALFTTSLLWVTYARKEGLGFFTSRSRRDVIETVRAALKEAEGHH